MNLLNALILGIVEGVTEFLPISSTAHLIFTSKFLAIPQSDFQKFFEVFIQGGAIIAVIVIYFRFVIKNPLIIKQILFSFFPTAIIGFLLYKVIKTIFFESSLLIIGALFVVGGLFLIIEYFVKNKKLKLTRTLDKINWQQAVIIGLIQSLAVIPGVSRSGIVMVGMMIMGYKRDESASYSFLLAVPTILAASLFDVWKTREVLMTSFGSLPYLLVGFISAFVTAYFSVNWLIGFLKKQTLSVFGLYRILLAIILKMI